MPWAKVYFPTYEDEVRGFYELARKTHVVSYKEGGRAIFQVPVSALGLLRDIGVPFEIAGQVDYPRPDHQPTS